MISEYQVKRLLEHEFGKRDFTPEDNYYLGLSDGDPTQGGIEPSGSIGYARCKIDNTKDFSTVGAEVIEGEPLDNFSLANRVAFSFSVLASEYANGVSHWFLSDSETGGNILYYGELAKPRPMPEDSQVIINPGEMIITRRNAE